MMQQSIADSVSPRGAEESIDRVERPTVARFRSIYFRRQRPVILTGVMDDWPARTWTRESLAAVVGNPTVPVLVMEQGQFRVDAQAGIRMVPMPFQEYLERIRDSEAPSVYLRAGLEGAFEPLRKAIQIPAYCLHSLGMKVCLWLGAAGNNSDIHFDMNHNVVAQISGRRRVDLFAPEDSRNLYPFRAPTLWHHSQVRLEAVDHETFPRFRRAHRIEIEIAPGEMLFIPRGWWHRFEALEPSIALSFFWITPSHVPAYLLNKAACVVRGHKV